VCEKCACKSRSTNGTTSTVWLMKIDGFKCTKAMLALFRFSHDEFRLAQSCNTDTSASKTFVKRRRFSKTSLDW